MRLVPNPEGTSWGPCLSVAQAKKWEIELVWVTPTATEWDRAADARKAAWEASPFYAASCEVGSVKR